MSNPAPSLPSLLSAVSSTSLFAVHPLPDTNDPLLPLLARHGMSNSRNRQQLGKREDTEATLIAEHRWRRVANDLGDRIVRKGQNPAAQDLPADIQDILRDWETRFQCLRRLRLYSILTSEFKALQAVLPPFYVSHASTSIREIRTFHQCMPFELILFSAVLPAYLGSGDKYPVIADLQDILATCRSEHQRSGDEMWEKHIVTATLALSGILVGMGELVLARDTLQSQANAEASSAILEALIYVQLEMGDISSATQTYESLQATGGGSDSHAYLALLTAQGKWAEAQALAGQLETADPTDISASNARGLCSLYLADTGKAMSTFQTIKTARPAHFFNNDTGVLISNYNTLLDLRPGNAQTVRLALLKEAGVHAGEGFQTEILRL